MSSFVEALQGSPMRWFLGFALATVVALAGHRTRSLAPSGTVAATLAGGIIVGTGGWWTGMLLVAFSVSSSALSHAPTGARQQIVQVRGSRRDAIQVLANGGPPVCFAVASAIAGDPAPWLIGTAAGIAGAAADTWATEIGRRSNRRPRMFTTWRPVAVGTSGAISSAGTGGAAAGSMFVAALASFGAATGIWIAWPALPILVVVTLAGFLGALLDSLLGATIQGIWWCPSCETTTESSVHRCGSQTRQVRGVAWLDNDVVNTVSIAGSAFAGLIICKLWM